MVILATARKLLLTQGNTQLVTIKGLQDNSTTPPTFLNAATLVCTLLDEWNNQMAECINVSFVYITGSSGNYQASFGDSNFMPAIGTGYTLLITGSQGIIAIRREIPVEIVPASN